MHGEAARATDDLLRERPAEQLGPTCPLRLGNDQMGEVVGAGIVHHRTRDVLPRDRDRLAAEALRKPERVGGDFLPRLVMRAASRDLHIDDGPRSAQPIGEAPCVSDQPLAAPLAVDADQQPVARGPGAGNGVAAHVSDHLLVDALRRPPQRQLAQRRQIARREIMANCALGLVRHVNLAVLQSLDQILGREVDDLDIIRRVDDGIRHGLAHADARDARHHVVQALDVLDIQGRVNIDPGAKQLLHVEVALRMPAARCVAVRKLVHQHELRAAGEDAVQVHLLEAAAAILELPARHPFDAVQQRFGFFPSVRLDDARHRVDPLAPPGLGRQQHLVGLADTGRGAEKDLEAPSSIPPRRREQRVRRGSALMPAHPVGLPAGTAARRARRQAQTIADRPLGVKFRRTVITPRGWRPGPG